MNKSGSVTSSLHDKMQEDLVKLITLSNDYGPQNSQEAFEATRAALQDLLFGLSRDLSAENEFGQFNLASVLVDPAQFFGSGKHAGELINLDSLKPETIVLIMKAVLMQLDASAQFNSDRK
jgi:hypothetical protein